MHESRRVVVDIGKFTINQFMKLLTDHRIQRTENSGDSISNPSSSSCQENTGYGLPKTGEVASSQWGQILCVARLLCCLQVYTEQHASMRGLGSIPCFTPRSPSPVLPSKLQSLCGTVFSLESQRKTGCCGWRCRRGGACGAVKRLG